MRNIFLEKSYTCGLEASPKSFYRKQKLIISQGQQFEVLQSLLLLYVQAKVYQNILKLRCWPPAFTLYKAFLKNKKRYISPYLIFCTIFKEKYSFGPRFIIAWLPLLLEIVGNMFIAIICCLLCDVINFKTFLAFLSSLFSS